MSNSDSEKQFPAVKYALIFMLTAIGCYFLNFSLLPYFSCQYLSVNDQCDWIGFSSSTGTWGEFGDFVGGILNPFIGFLTVFLLITTVRQQAAAIKQTETALSQAGASLVHAENALIQNEKALEITREEIKIAREEISLSREINKKTEEALNAQLGVSRSQNHLSNYFEHRNQYIEYINSLENNSNPPKYNFSSRYLHTILYPGAQYGDLKIDPIWPHKLLLDIKETTNYISNLTSNTEEERNKFLDLLINQTQNRNITFSGIAFFNLPEKKMVSIHQIIDRALIETHYVPVQEAFYSCCEDYAAIQKMFAFDADFLSLDIKLTINLIRRFLSVYPLLPNTEDSNNSLPEEFLNAKLIILPELKVKLDVISYEISRRMQRPDTTTNTDPD